MRRCVPNARRVTRGRSGGRVCWAERHPCLYGSRRTPDLGLCASEPDSDLGGFLAPDCKISQYVRTSIRQPPRPSNHGLVDVPRFPGDSSLFVARAEALGQPSHVSAIGTWPLCQWIGTVSVVPFPYVVVRLSSA